MKPILQKTALLAVGMALDILRSKLLEKILIIEMRTFVANRVDDLECVIRIFLDNNPQNDQQLLQLWEREKVQILDDSLEVAAAYAKLKIEDPKMAAIVSEFLSNASEAPAADAQEHGIPIYDTSNQKRLKS